MKRAISIGVLLLTTSACASSAPQGEEGSAAARAAMVALIDADNRGDLDEALSSYTDDAVWLMPGGVEVKGKVRIAARYREMYANFEPRLSIVCEAALTTGDKALVKGTTSGELRRRDGAASVSVHDRFVAVLRWENNRWRIEGLSWQEEK